MLYAAMTFWLVTIVMSAWGVHRIWCGLSKPRVVNIILLPGTLVAQLGHVLGLLITGATVNDTTLYKDDETGEPGTTQDARPRIPVIGPMAIGLLPLLACTVAIFFVARYLGETVLTGMQGHRAATVLPTSVAAFWQFLRDGVTLVEALVDAVIVAWPGRWPLWLFLYLMVCLPVRMAPFPGYLRGSLGAIVLLGLISAGLGLLIESLPGVVERGWATLSLTAATVLFLLLVTALVRGAVSLVKVLTNRTE